MNDFEQWAARHPAAAADLRAMINANPPETGHGEGKSEQWAQQQVRFSIARAGGRVWRNNVGATPAKCPACGMRQQPVRYGLCNDSAQLNEQYKSSDLIGAVPFVIKPEHVGATVARFVSVECKRPGWRYTGSEHEAAQLRWLTMIAQLGGVAYFSTGEGQP